MSHRAPPLLALPQEIRDQIYSFLFLSATATTEHPFPECIPRGWRFKEYFNICLVNRALYNDAKAYFTKYVAPKATFYFSNADHLRALQRKAIEHPVLKQMNFHIRCGNGTYRTSRPVRCSFHVFMEAARRETEQIEALIRIQPGFEWWMDELPGFYRIFPAVQTNYGYFPATGPKAWKPRDYGMAVLGQTGGEICDWPFCAQRARGRGNTLGVTEVHYPLLHQSRVPVNGTFAGKGILRLSCFVWTLDFDDPNTRHTKTCSTMVLEGKLLDVWVPDDPINKYFTRRRQRMV